MRQLLARGHCLAPATALARNSRRIHLRSSAAAAQPTVSAAAAAAAAAASSACASPSSSSSSSPSSPTTSLSSEAVYLYRVFLRHARLLPVPERRAEAESETRRQFREIGPSPTALQDPAVFRQRLDSAYSKLSFMRMATPKIHHPRLGPTPPYPAARALLGLGSGEADDIGSQSYMYIGGEIIPGNSRPRGPGDGRTLSNSQGVTDEQIKRHHALVERMHFRGPYWEGKPRF